MDFSEMKFVRPLGEAENRYLEVLITDFDLRRTRNGAELSVTLDNTLPTIWQNRGKDEVMGSIPDFELKWQQYQEALDAILIKGTKDSFEDCIDRDFPYRYVSGGTLPIVRIGDKDYYCLIYRERHPIGWNIANGGSDARHELLNPFDAVERELREELIMFDVERKALYVFDAEFSQPVSRPEYIAARRLWLERAKDLGLPKLEEMQEVAIPYKWIDGPDTLRVCLKSDRAGRACDKGTIDGCYLNINAEDFGIEIDRIVKIDLDEGVVLFDGETGHEEMINSIVGLFEVGRMNDLVHSESTHFVPDIFFYDCEQRESDPDGKALMEVVENKFVPRMAKAFPDWDRTEWDKRAETGTQFDLCPVTRRIVKRGMPLHTPAAVPSGDHDVFICFASEAREVAETVRTFLSRQRPGVAVFFSDESDNADFGSAIDEALESARCMVAVAAEPWHMRKLYPQYEYRAFHNDILTGAKRGQPQLVSVVKGFRPVELPLPLRRYRSVAFAENNPEGSLAELLPLVDRAIR